MSTQRFRSCLGLLLLGAALLGCSSNGPYQSSGSQTNWLSSCQFDAQCGGLSCLCGVCTRACTSDAICGQTTSCVAADETGAVAQCSGGVPPVPGLCLTRCGGGTCQGNEVCIAGVCGPLPEPSATITIDPSSRYQQLVGFGASVAYVEGQLTAHPQKAALYRAIFEDLGLDALRFRNRYRHLGDDDLTSTGQLVTAATAALGHPPQVFLSSWSPPPELKGSGALFCSGNAATCTLSKTAAGTFDYAGFAEYWRGSLTAYASAGVTPDYIGLQNNPNWVPTSAEYLEACKFLPVEGSELLTVGQSTLSVRYPGFAEAQAATVAAIATLANRPKIAAPEVSSFDSIADYLPSLDFSQTDAVAHQLYGVNPDTVDLAALGDVGKLEGQYARPIFITEMKGDGFGTALLIHYATVVEGASAYLQSALVGADSGPGANSGGLIGLGATTFSIQDPYHAMRHFAGHTDPGWTRVSASSDASGLLASAWLSPTERDLTVILINRGSVELSAQLTIPDTWTTSAVTRSVFSGIERSAALGTLPPSGVVRLPAAAVMTIALSR